MVALRERKTRPSYSLLAGGQEILSDSDGANEGNEQAEGDDGAAHLSENGDQTSISSGDASEFELEAGPSTISKGRRATKKRRDVNLDPALSSGDDDVVSDGVIENEDDMMEVTKEDDEPSEEELVSVDDLPKPAAEGVKKESRPISAPRRSVNFPKPQTPGQPNYIQAEVNLLPPAYRQLIKESTVLLAKPPAPLRNVEADRIREKDRTRTWGVEVFPSGPSTPYSVRLTQEPTGRQIAEVEYVKEDADHVKRKHKRRAQGYKISQAVPLISPWQIWRGESWWPEMFRDDWGGDHLTGSTESEDSVNKGKGKMKTRSDVRLGLDSVGRLSLEQMEFLTHRYVRSNASPGS